MKTQTNTPGPVTALQLLNRQLTDWQTLHAELERREAPGNQLEYCEEQIARLSTEIFNLKNGQGK